MSLENKVAIITGSGSGMGASTAKLFAKEKANLVVVDIDETGAKKTLEEISTVGLKHIAVIADVSKEEEVSNIISKTLEEFGKIDILVNNAGIVRKENILNGSILEHYDSIMNTNLRSVVIFTTLAAPHLVKTQGSIVNMSSVAAMVPKLVFVSPSYVMSKAGVSTFTDLSAKELGEFGVRVNAVCPGPVKTRILASANMPEIWHKYAEATVLKKYLEPEEVSDLILFLVSDKSKSITGSHFVIDAGMKVK